MKKLPSTKNLQCFIEVAKQQSFTKASAKLFLTQSAISKNIQQLEQDLEVQLFKRNLNQISLTKKGKIYYNKVSKILEDLRQLSTNLKSQETTQEISINIAPSLSNYFINLLKDFKEQCPNYQINLANNTDNKNCDVEIAAFKNKAPNSKLLFDENLLLIGNKNCKINKLPQITKHNFLIHASRPGSLKDFLNRNNCHLNLNKMPDKFEHFYMIVNAIKENLGIGLVPDFLVKDDIKNKLLTNICNISFKSGYGYYLVQKSPESQKFIEEFGGFLSKKSKKI